MTPRWVEEIFAGNASVASVARQLGASIHEFPWWARLLPLHGFAAITLGRRIYLRGDLPGSPAWLVLLLRHELVHVAQYRREGLVPFLYQYLREYLILRADGLEPVEAYRSISFEREAREAELSPELRLTPAEG